MSTVVLQEKNLVILNYGMAIHLENDVEYGVLNSWDEKTLIDAAECLAETFAGIIVDGVRVSEPMTNACKLSKDDMFEFVSEYLKAVVDHGLCVVAKERSTGKVLAVTANEDFDPEAPVPVFEGNLAPMNEILKFLIDLDERLVKTIEAKKGSKIEKGEYVHAFMAGARLSKCKRHVIKNLVDLLHSISIKKGYKGIFAEATNKRSQKVLTDLCEYHPVYDLEGKPILTNYQDVEAFKSVPEAIATDCRILFKAFNPEFDI